MYVAPDWRDRHLGSAILDRLLEAVVPGSLLPGAGPDCGLEGRPHARTLKQSYAVRGTGLNAS
jgi:hypothetical protein